VAEVVAKGEVEIGCRQITSSYRSKGADYIARCPRTSGDVKFAAGVLTVSKQPEVARAFLIVHRLREAAPLIRKSSMEPWH